MQGFSIQFAYPWLLLLLIPAAVLTVLPYFLLSKRYRRTRNRIISMIMHGLVMLLAILALSGITFHYSIHNDENEVLLLVDVSDTEDYCSDRRDRFVEQVVQESSYDGYNIGIVTFGFDQRYVVPFTSDPDRLLNDYYATTDYPDTTATDIAAALRYGASLFHYPESAKIILITDGKQTDENARTIVRSIAAQGIRVDTVNITEADPGDSLRVQDIVFPDYHIGINEEFSLDVQLVSTQGDRMATVELYDNGSLDTETGVQEVPLIAGSQSVTFRKSFTEQGVHEVVVRVETVNDGLAENNSYCSYFNVEVFTRVLILQQEEGQSDKLTSILGDAEVPYEPTVVNVRTDAESLPKTLEALCNYDQVILNNIANSDLPAGFDALLYNYVYNAGGGLFTTGGTAEGQAHAYKRSDLANTLLQQMLPVQAINYTPPVGVEIVIDVSGSMAGEKLEAAKEGALDCLDVLNERDYVGIVTLSTTTGNVLSPTPRTQDAIIKEAINSVRAQGNTTYSSAIRRAGDALKSISDKVDKKHIIIVSDGAPTEPEEEYLPLALNYHEENDISISIIAIGMDADGFDRMDRISVPTGGETYLVDDLSQLSIVMQDDLRAEAIKESAQKEFHPIINDPLSNLAAGFDPNGVENVSGISTRWQMKTTLDGYFGTRARVTADTFMVGEFGVPIYSEWKFGMGKVGSFMCDVYGDWSEAFLADACGKRFIQNVVAGLMPLESIRTQEIKLNLREENYMNQLGISAPLEEGDVLEGEIVLLSEGGEQRISLNVPEEEVRSDVYVTTYLGADNGYSRCNFVIKTSGVYRIEVRRRNAAGEVTAEAEIYKGFAYSAEYTEWQDTDGSTDNGALLAEIAENGGGRVIPEEEPWGAIEGLIPVIQRVYDPRLAFMITAMVLFLIDILVRKFKFKWPHEIIREYRAKKAEHQE